MSGNIETDTSVYCKYFTAEKHKLAIFFKEPIYEQVKFNAQLS